MVGTLDDDETDDRQQHQQRHRGREDRLNTNGGVHHIHGADGYGIRGNQKHQRHVIVIQRSQAIVVFRLVQQDVRSCNAFPVQLLLDHVKTPPLNIIRFLQRLVNIPGANDIAIVRVVIGQNSVLLDDIGGRAAAVGRGGIILLHGSDILQQHDMGKADMLLSHGDGGIQFLRKHQKASINCVGFRNKGMAFFFVQQMADIIPDTCGAIAQIRRALLIQKHHPASIQIRAEIIFHMDDMIRHILDVFEMISLYCVIQSFHQIPMGLKTAVQICLNLGDHFLQLIGTLLNRQLHQLAAQVAYAQRQRNQQDDYKRDGQKIFFCVVFLLHLGVHLIFLLLIRHLQVHYRRVM